MNASFKSLCVLSVAIGLSLLTFLAIQAQEMAPSAADLAALHAFKDTRSIEAIDSTSSLAQETTPTSADLAVLRAFKDAQSIEAFHPETATARQTGGETRQTATVHGPEGYATADWTLTAGEAFLDNNWEIVVTRSDTKDLRRLTTDGATDVRPAQNRDGSQIVFTSNRTGNTDLFLINSDGSGLQQLTSNPTSDNFAAWFPSSDRIVFASKRDDNWEIYTMNADGSNQTRISTDSLASDIYPSVSPDGSQIAWIKRKGRSGQIWLMNLDGANPHPIGSACDYMENLHWMSNEYLLTDCDIDSDVMNEAVAFTTQAQSSYTVYDVNQSLGEIWTGGTLAAPDATGYFVPHFAGVLVRYRIENQNVYIDDITSNIFGPMGTTQYTFPNTALWSWVKTDWTAPVSWFASSPSVVYGTWSGSQAPPSSPDGVDTGPSGLASFRLDYRRNGGDWAVAGKLLPGQDPAGHVSFHVELGDQIDLRSAAQDYAGNVEDVTGKKPYTYHYYRGRVSGQITDRKGFPIAGATYTSAELLHPSGTSAASGALADDVVKESRVGLTITHPAFQTQSYWLDLSSSNSTEATFTVTLKSADDTLQDGSFEQKNLQDWVSEPVTATRLLQGSAYLGQQHLLLGQPAAYIGTVSQRPTGDTYFSTVYESDLAYDEDGSLHILQGSLYQECIQGTCSPTENLYGARRADAPERGVVLRARAGRVVAVRKETAGASQLLRFFERRNGVWSDQVIATTNGIDFGPDMQIGPDGTLYLVWNERIPDPSNGVYRATVRYREQKGGVWSAAQSLYTALEGQNVGGILVRLDANGDPHIFYATDKIYEVARSSNGSWSQPLLVDETLSAYDFVFDSANVLHGVYRRSAIFYASRTNGVWSDYEFVAENPASYEVSPRLVLLSDGRLAMIRGDAQLYLRQSDGKWTGPHYVGAPSAGAVQGALLAAGPQNHLALLTLEDNGEYTRSFVLYELNAPPLNEVSGQSRLVRHFVVPESLHHPTLFFAASFESENTRKNQDRFLAEIDDGQVITRPLEISITGGGWQEYALDLLPWQGKEITLTLAVDAVADNTFAWARLDAMQIASWNTPLVRAVTVASGPTGRTSIPIGVSATVVISGENFLDGATVAFGSSQATAVKVVSSQRIEAKTPADLAPGLYTVAVTNPGGVSAMQPSALAVGEQVYLPAVTR